MINLELPTQLQQAEMFSRQVADQMFRPISRKYDTAEHETPVELEPLRQMLGRSFGPSDRKRSKKPTDGPRENRNGKQMIEVLGMTQMCWGDVGMLLSIPGIGLGNAAIHSVSTPEQLEKFGGLYASMAITEPGAGSDSGNIKTTAVLDGDEWVLNGEKIFVTAGERCDAVVCWANVDPTLGKAGIKSFLVLKGTPGMEVARLEHKLGIRASDTATILFTNCRVPKDHMLGTGEIGDKKKSFGGVMQTFDNTRPGVAGMAVGVGRAALDMTLDILKEHGTEPSIDKPLFNLSALDAELARMEADLEGARLLILKATWMADNGLPNSKEASMAKAKAGRVGNYITLRCVELLGTLGYSEEHLIEKFARDSKILDIFEGTQQIQQLIIARRVLGKSSKELR